MSITFHNNQFTFSTKNIDYIFAVSHEKYIVPLYWGEKLKHTCGITDLINEFI